MTNNNTSSDFQSTASAFKIEIETAAVAVPLFVTIFIFCMMCCFIIYKRYRTAAQEQELKKASTIDDNNYAQVVDWFTNTLELPQYLSLFIEHGYNSVYRIKEITDKTRLQNIGINKIGHQTLILTEISKLREYDIDQSCSVINIQLTEPSFVLQTLNSETIRDLPDLPLSRSSTKRIDPKFNTFHSLPNLLLNPLQEQSASVIVIKADVKNAKDEVIFVEDLAEEHDHEGIKYGKTAEDPHNGNTVGITKKQSAVKLDIIQMNDDNNVTEKGELEEGEILEEMLSDVLKKQLVDPNAIHQMNVHNDVNQQNNDSDSDKSDDMYEK